MSIMQIQIQVGILKFLYITDFHVWVIGQIFIKYLEGTATVLIAGNISRIKLFYREQDETV